MRRLVAATGDLHPLQYGGGLIFKVSGPHKGGADYELDLFEAEEQEGGKVQRRTILLEKASETEWYFDDLERVASYVGMTKEELFAAGTSDDMTDRAYFYESLARYHGADNFDSYPVNFTESEARTKYRAMFKRAQERGLDVRV